ncbi:hypothetical protein GCM10009754_41480 [Amycolatopsis minnesotensis]|uniref:PPM-type phosphatase domain-containing protein n=1 Tax=Amycolatopsis minnesotensis TaxID=337894 RepID=A0ABP5CK11_9PSEU
MARARPLIRCRIRRLTLKGAYEARPRETRDPQLPDPHAAISRKLEDALRPPPPRVRGVELAVRYKPAETDAPVGGDHYDWFVLPDGTLHITVVDAVGHGVTSTRNALNVTHTIRTLALEGYPIEELISRAATIIGSTRPGDVATVLLARVDRVAQPCTSPAEAILPYCSFPRRARCAISRHRGGVSDSLLRAVSVSAGNVWRQGTWSCSTPTD